MVVKFDRIAIRTHKIMKKTNYIAKNSNIRRPQYRLSFSQMISIWYHSLVDKELEVNARRWGERCLMRYTFDGRGENFGYSLSFKDSRGRTYDFDCAGLV